jgi:hypothetical protein
MSQNLKPPLYSLLLAAEVPMWEDTIAGRKRITVREGHRDYRAGRPMVLVTPDVGWAVMVDIVEVRHCLLRELTAEELAADGFRDHQHAVAELARFYPGIGLDSPVTAIRWDNVRGHMVEEYREMQEEGG